MKRYILPPSAAINRVAAICSAASILSLCIAFPARSQSQTFLGLEIRLHDVEHSGGFRTVPLYDFTAEKGNGFGQSIGLKLQHHFSPAWSVSGVLSYNRLPASFETDLHNPSGEIFTIESPSGTVPDTVDKDFSVRSEVKYTTVSLDVMAEWRPFIKESKWSLGLAAGPTFGFVESGTLKQRLSVISPENARLTNSIQLPAYENGKTIGLYEGDIPEMKSSRFGVRAGIFAEFGNLDSGIIISPGVFYDLGLTDVASTENWKVTMLSGQLSVLIGL